LKHVGTEKQTYFENSFATLKDEIWSMNDGKTLFIDSNEFLASETETVFFDDIHVSDKGYKIWTEKLFEKLNDKDFFNSTM
jgi:lysophospholipase L1-like esterase